MRHRVSVLGLPSNGFLTPEKRRGGALGEQWPRLGGLVSKKEMKPHSRHFSLALEKKRHGTSGTLKSAGLASLVIGDLGLAAWLYSSRKSE